MNSADSNGSELILASSSTYRRELLERLGLTFDSLAPDIDESPLPGESIAACCCRLARSKAQAVLEKLPQACVLASDQLCSLHDQPLGKPGSLRAARAQLARLSGQTCVFYTAIHLQRADREWRALDRTEVRFRQLDQAEIERYLRREPALDCAGSFKSEGLGITLCEAIHSEDPSALIGLPLIATARVLREAGFSLP